jgi:hypothetical protein
MTNTTTTTQPFDGKAPRALDELDGTLLLLLPTATLVPTAGTPGVIGAADGAQLVQEAYQHDESTMPTAWYVPSCKDRKAQERVDAEARRRATEIGLAKADAEQVAIAKARRDIFALNYHTKNRVEQANAIAHTINNTRGVEIQQDNWMGKEPLNKEKPSFTDEQEEYAFSTSASGGYEVAEYGVSEYTGGCDYEVSEYKSVYD